MLEALIFSLETENIRFLMPKLVFESAMPEIDLLFCYMSQKFPFFTRAHLSWIFFSCGSQPESWLIEMNKALAT